MEILHMSWRHAIFVLLLLCIGDTYQDEVETENQVKETIKDNHIIDRRKPVVPSAAPKRILVTGAAGFVGFHAAKKFIKEGHLVVGFDNFNDFYDPNLKKDRAYELHKIGVKFFKDDLCNEDFLAALLKKYNFTHVLHVAAQAGVRFSLDHPLAYVRNNIECQIYLVEQVKFYPNIKLIYASTSSVYGKTNPVPFNVEANVDHPGNMYAASKRTDEILCEYYCNAYNVTTVGLRFFTVYGPWGRPDMAVFKFVEATLRGEPIPLFVSNVKEKPLGRDFTYVEDIIQGVIAAMDYEPVGCKEVFNLGLGSPVSVPDMVKMLAEELNTTLKINELPLPPTEILQTWANISVSEKFLHFSPKTNLRTGIQRFVKWYTGYLKQKDEEQKSELPIPSDVWYQRICDNEKKRNDRNIHAHDLDLAERFDETRNIRHKVGQWGDDKWLEQRKQTIKQWRHNKWTFIQGKDPQGHVLRTVVSLKAIIPRMEIQTACEEHPQCVAFTSTGILMGSVGPIYTWTKNPTYGARGGVYVADMDPCASGTHTCHENATCAGSTVLDYKCSCLSPYDSGDGVSCSPQYDYTPYPEELQQDYKLNEYMLLKPDDMKKKTHMVFMKGKDIPIGTYLVAPDAPRDRESLTNICFKDPLCIAINSKGELKRRVTPVQHFINMTNPGPEDGVYVYDLNYCLFFPKGCQVDENCKQLGPADYKCVKIEHMEEFTKR